MSQAKKTTANFDEILTSISAFGRWQIFLYVATCSLVIIPSTLQVIGIVFFSGTPRFHCVTPNVTCEDSKCCPNCTEYVFDGPFTSSVSEWNLICDRAFAGANVQAAYSAGMLLGSLVFGATSDFFGRRFCIYLCAVFLAIFSLGSALVDCLSFFAFLRFFASAFAVGLFVAHYVFALELFGPTYRTRCDKIQSLFWTIGAGLIALLGYLIPDWRTLLILCSFPPLLVFSIYTVFPESARWLAAKGHLAQAHAVLMKYASKSSLSVDSDSIMTKLTEYHQSEVESRADSSSRRSFLDLIRSPRLRKRTVILSFNWMVISMVYYGFLLYISRLSGSPYLNLFLMYLSDIPTHLICWVLLQKFGRRIPHSAMMIAGGFTLLLVLAVPKDQKGTITALAFIGRFMASGSFSNIYLYSSELYPTELRNQGIGVCSTSARVGSIIAPYIVMLAQLPGMSATLPMVIFGCLTVAAGLVALFLPETLLCQTYQTVEDINQDKEFYGIICMEKPRPCPLHCFRSKEADKAQSPSAETQLL